MRRIFVFGSNLRGAHGAGAALEARRKHGAVWGCGEGLSGYAYGIPTKDRNLGSRTLDEIQISVEKFLAFARETSETTYEVTRIGCGLAGYKDHQIGPMFAEAPVNCVLPLNWEQYRHAKST